MAALLIEQYAKLLDDLKTARRNARHYHQSKNTQAFEAARNLMVAQRRISEFLKPLDSDSLISIYESRFERSADYEESVLIQKLSRV